MGLAAVGAVGLLPRVAGERDREEKRRNGLSACGGGVLERLLQRRGGGSERRRSDLEQKTREIN